MAAVLERSRRATAGQRMSSLVGKAAEEDDTFWNHSTWAEDVSGGDDIGSEDGSYQEEGEIPVDAFDSDFNDSEDSSDEDEGKDEEAQAVAQEQDAAAHDKKKKNTYSDPQRNKGAAYVDAVTAGRELLQRKRGSKDSKKRRGMGEGMNAGIVLNLPGHARRLHYAMGPTIASVAGAPVATLPVPVKPIIIPAPPLVPIIRTRRGATSTGTATDTSDSTTTPIATTTTAIAAATTPSIISPNKARKLRKSTVSKTARATVSTDVHTRSSGKVDLVDATNGGATVVYKMGKGRRRFTQEELLVEAANTTEPNNERWMLGRKRGQEQDSMASSSSMHQGGGGGHHRQRDFYSGNGAWRIVEKFHSRRGCYNTLTFPEMDHVPALFVTQGHRPRRQIPISSSSSSSKLDPTISNNPNSCVITGKKARYRDPKTMCGYHDIAAFRELRRRLEAGESLDQSLSSAASAKPNTNKQTNETTAVPSRKRSNSSTSSTSTKRPKTTTATTPAVATATVTQDNNKEAPQPKSIQSVAANGGMTTRRHALPSPLAKPVIKEESPPQIPPLIDTNGTSAPATSVIKTANGTPLQPKSSVIPTTASSLPSKGSATTTPNTSAPLSKDTKATVIPKTASSVSSNGTVASAPNTSAPLSKDRKSRVVPKTAVSAPSKRTVTTTSKIIATPSSSLPSNGTFVATPSSLSKAIATLPSSSDVAPETTTTTILVDPPTTVTSDSMPSSSSSSSPTRESTKSRLLAPSPNSL
eukprot:scaffold63270_cov38-Attheya_sp.AAC.1